MKKNVGSVDKTVRIIFAVIIFAAGFYFQTWWGLLGLVPLGTALTNSCPLYMPFGISTKK